MMMTNHGDDGANEYADVDAISNDNANNVMIG